MFNLRQITIYQVFFTTTPIVFGVTHLVLFLFLRKARENLWFAVFLFFYGTAIWCDYQQVITLHAGGAGAWEDSLFYLRLHRLTAPIFMLFALKFLDTLFHTQPRRWFRLLLALCGVSAALGFIDPLKFSAVITVLSFTTTLGALWIIWRAARNGKEPVALAAVGFIILFFFSLFDFLMDIGVLRIFKELYNPYALGTVGFVLSMSVFLARRYEGMYDVMIRRERAAAELEEARRMQLGMLPSCLSGVPGLDICFHMSTAAEVGGDYYDYLFPNRETLVLAVGDATGHGLKSGMMVASVKTLFRAAGDTPDIPEFFTMCGRTLKQMNMGRMYMALTVLRLDIQTRTFSVSCAGMPPVLIYRASTDRVEDIAVKAPPLGAIARFPYASQTFNLEPEDTALIMTDGFAELFNEKGDMLGYERVRELFRCAPPQNAPAVVEHLLAEAKKWQGNQPQQDDITFMVVRALPTPQQTTAPRL